MTGSATPQKTQPDAPSAETRYLGTTWSLADLEAIAAVAQRWRINRLRIGENEVLFEKHEPASSPPTAAAAQLAKEIAELDRMPTGDDLLFMSSPDGPPEHRAAPPEHE